MALLNPILLYGLAAIAVPLVIHLMARRPSARTSWAAMRFLKTAVERNRPRMKLQGGILLLLRCALFALLAAALSRPAWHRHATAAAAPQKVEALLLIDQSASMAQTDGAATRFEKAQQAAEQVLDSLPAGSAVWLESDIVQGELPVQARDRATVHQAIRTAHRGDLGPLNTNWSMMIEGALGVLQRQNATAKQLYIFTDGQATDWKGLTDIVSKLGAAKGTVQTHIIITGETERRNLAVTDLRLASALAPAGEMLRFEAEVSNFGSEEVRNATVDLAVDAAPPSDQQVLASLAPGESKKVTLSAIVGEAGFHTVTARVPPDRAPADDARTLALRTVDKVNVLLVDGDPGATPSESEVFQLRNALTPVPPEQREKYFIQTKTVTPTQLKAEKLDGVAAVVLADVAEVSETVLTALEKYLRDGGGLVVFPGPKTNADFYNAQMHNQRGFLPAAFGEARGNAEQQEQYFTFQTKDYRHPIVAPWQDAETGTLGSARFFRALALIPGQAGSSSAEAGLPRQVLAYADGQPAVMERKWGRGRVVQFSSTASTKWNDLGMRPIYVPLVQRVLGALLVREDQWNAPCGTYFVLPVEAGTAADALHVIMPDGNTAHVRSVTTPDGRTEIACDDTYLAGGYEVRQGDEKQPFLRFALQADPEESKLAELSPAELTTLKSVAQVRRWTSAEDFRAQLNEEQTGLELWLPLALLGVVVAAGETVLGNRWSKAK
jgi:hypothetical protein